MSQLIAAPAETSVARLPREQRADGTRVAVCIALVAVTWLVFGQTVRHEFVNYDDHAYVVDNALVREGLTSNSLLWTLTHAVSSNWHPLTMLSHIVDVELFGLAAGGHHFTNVLLHATAAVLLFTFLGKATGAFWPSAFVAAVFAIHPLRVESVAWIAERKDVLSGVFFMLTLHMHLAYVRDPSPRGRWLTVAVFACGLLSKPMLVSLPIVLLLCDYWPLRRHLGLRELVYEKIPLFALAAVAALIALVTQAKATASFEAIPLSHRIANAAGSILTYIAQMVVPVKLAPFYPYPADHGGAVAPALSVCAIIALTLIALLLRRTKPYLAVGWFWYLVMLLPVLGLVQVGAQAHADRYTYLPQIGLYLIVAWAAAEATARWRYRKAVLSVAAVTIVVALAGLSARQTKIWQNSETLWRHTLAVTERNYIAHGSLARFLWSQQRVAEAVPHFEAALAITPNDVDFHNTAGVGLIKLGRPSEAIAHWSTALALRPDDRHAQGNLAWVFATCPEPAMRDGQRAVQLARGALAQRGEKSPSLLRTLAAAQAEAGQFAEAIETAREALQLAQVTGPPELVSELDAQIRDYAQSRPLRDASLAGAHPL